MNHARILAFMTAILFVATAARGETIGSVDTVFKLIGRNHQIVVEAFDDPKVEGVTCYLSRARAGGISGTLGVAEDPSDASIACRQVGAIRFKEKTKEGERVFSKRTSLVFKKIQVVRFYDKKRNVLIYLVYSDRPIEGSPKNSVSAVPITAWNKAEP